ncbi:MAG: hypothetical protein JW801_19090 [Bacteroidales bacterium]|nr:hypothetical protein [Bacteroidales bacterium]
MDQIRKKGMQKVVLALIFGFSLNSIFAQQLKLGSEVYPEHRYYPLRGEIFYKAYTQIKGNAYLSDDWVEGDIFLSNGLVLKDVKFKADVYAHDLLVYNEYLKRVVVLDRTQIDHFVMLEDGQPRYFKRTQSGKNFKMGHNEFFVEVLQEGPMALYKLYFNEVVPLKLPEMPYIDEFYLQKDYYLVWNGEWDEISLRRATLIRKFPERKDEIKKFIRKNKLRMREEKDFARLVDYLSIKLQADQVSD